MPPSPALRYSPGREPRAENHKRGRSLEGGLFFKGKDDDLALFNEMQSRERENFLFQSSDDLEDTFSTKLRHFSDFKLGISIPVRGESSELLNADREKNDYDWLLTPPDTPLFPSLDDEPPPVNVASRGRLRSQPITISRSSTMEKSYRSSRGSASPNRLSPSPRSGNSSVQSRGRPSPVPHSSPTHSQRTATPSRRPSPPPNKASTPAPRSSTPTPRRTSTGSGARGTSPIRTSRGNSASPKIRAWQSNIPGFSSEAPPNLRTSLADRPASYVRGSSPASRNGRDSGSRFGRQSMSPTASRSVSSSHSQDRISSHSRGSVASSGDDDVDSVQSIHVGSLDRLASKRTETFPNNKATAFSKKSMRITSPSSVPKRSFDSALRQMDHWKAPQNMFRPLLSSVPSSTFYVGKTNSAHRPLISRNSSVTTSSNASSDQCTSGAPDTEGSDHHQEDMTIHIGEKTYSDVQEEVFAFDKVDMLNKNVKHDVGNESDFRVGDSHRNPATEHEPNDSEEFSHQEIDIETSSASDTLCVKADFSEVDCTENIKVCSRCGCKYHTIQMIEKDINLCPDCSRQDSSVAASSLETIIVAPETSSGFSLNFSEEDKPHDELETQVSILKLQSQVIDEVESRIIQQGDGVKCGQAPSNERSNMYARESSLLRSLMEGDEQRIASQHGAEQPTGSHRLPDSDSGGQQLLRSGDSRGLKVDISEGAGISVLLKRSSSIKGPVVQARTFVASSITYDDFSYTRDSANSLRSSFGHGSTSASSSVDFSSGRHVETRVQRQLSGRKSDMENNRYDTNTRPQSTGSSLSGTSNHTNHALGLATSTYEENIEAVIGDMKNEVMEGATQTSHGKVVASENKEMGVPSASFTGAIATEEDLYDHNGSNRLTDASTSSLSCHTVGVLLEENSVALLPTYEDSHLHENEDDFPNNASSVADVEASIISPDPPVEMEQTMLNSSVDVLNDVGVPTHSSLASISEIETENLRQVSPGSENDDVSTNSKSTINEFQDHSIPTHSDREISTSVPEHGNSGHLHVTFEDSTVMVQEGSKARSLTLEEATDTILFCSSIVHDLAYRAAAIAIEKEDSVLLEGSRPAVTVLGKSTADRKDSRSRNTGKRTSKSMKVRQKKMESDTKSPSSKTENDENANESMVRNVGLPNKMDSAKPPKLESKCNCTIM